MPQGWACPDRACNFNKTVTDSNSKHVFGSFFFVLVTYTAEHPKAVTKSYVGKNLASHYFHRNAYRLDESGI